MNYFYKEDFKAAIAPCDALGKAVSLAEVDWDAAFYTAGYGRTYRAAHRGGEWVNAQPREDGSVVVAFDSHGLAPGELRCELTVHLPDADFADGCRDMPVHVDTATRLTSAPCCRGAEAMAQWHALLPYVKGDKGKSPKISEQGTWLVWDDVRGGYYDTGVSASAGGNDEDAVEKDVVEAANLVLSYSGGDDEAATKEDIENEACRILNG